jgi:hypothetical protein
MRLGPQGSNRFGFVLMLWILFSAALYFSRTVTPLPGIGLLLSTSSLVRCFFVRVEASSGTLTVVNFFRKVIVDSPQGGRFEFVSTWSGWPLGAHAVFVDRSGKRTSLGASAVRSFGRVSSTFPKHRSMHHECRLWLNSSVRRLNRYLARLRGGVGCESTGSPRRNWFEGPARQPLVNLG